MQNIENYQFISHLKQLPFVEEIWLFGSRARGDHQERADIDLAIVCPLASDKEWFDLLTIIENADTLLKIDCVRFDRLSPHNKLRENILKDKKVLYGKNNP